MRLSYLVSNLLFYVVALALFVGLMLSGCGFTSALAPEPMVCAQVPCPPCPKVCRADPRHADDSPALYCVERGEERVCIYQDGPRCTFALRRATCDAQWEWVGQKCEDA